VTDYLDRYGRARSVCHRLPPRVKLFLSAAAVVAGLAIPADHWPAHGALLCVLFAAMSLARIPFGFLFRRLGGFLLLAMMFSLSVPLSQGFRGGWEIMAGMVVRGSESFLAGLWLVNVIPFGQLLSTLRGIGMPAILIAILAFMYRFIFVLWDELDRMRAARRARSFDRGGAVVRWRVSAQMIGMLLIRALGRSERVYGAMCARGWDGKLRTLDP
jgi:cobalt/nickel transport system permease protein